ncbi:MAG: magnetosome protein MamC [Nitrospirae bacterium]|nr:magnetosome protein MamC [Magnetococcales bacterium]HAT51476.1 magnetic particle protein [Alphaproteobacteria bacterium]
MSFNLAMFLAKSTGGVGILGAVVGGSGALAKNIKRKARHEISQRELIVDTSKEAAGAGVATAFSAFTAGLVGGGLATSLGTAFIAAVVGKYAWDYTLDRIELQTAKKRQNTIQDDMDEVLLDPSGTGSKT